MPGPAIRGSTGVTAGHTAKLSACSMYKAERQTAHMRTLAPTKLSEKLPKHSSPSHPCRSLGSGAGSGIRDAGLYSDPSGGGILVHAATSPLGSFGLACSSFLLSCTCGRDSKVHMLTP